MQVLGRERHRDFQSGASVGMSLFPTVGKAKRGVLTFLNQPADAAMGVYRSRAYCEGESLKKMVKIG